MDRKNSGQNPTTATSRNWLFTFFTDEEKDFEDFKSWCVQLVVQPELCPDTGRRHYQGYVRCKKSVALPYLRRKLPGAHWDPRQKRTSPHVAHEKAKAYCSKEDTREPGTLPVIWGPDPQPGRRTDLLDWKEAIDSGAPDHELWESHFACMLRYSSALRQYRLAVAQRRSTPPQVHVFWGPTGTGKSRRAEFISRGSTTFWKPKGQWFDGYEGQTVAIFDDFRADVPFRLLLQVLDRYPLIVPVKGGFVNWNPSIVIFTSNHSPESWYSTTNEIPALLRRLGDGVVYQDTPWTPPVSLPVQDENVPPNQLEVVAVDSDEDL